MIVNIHERVLPGSPEVVGRLLDTLGQPGDQIWPAPRWPPLRLEGVLAPGVEGGDGSLRRRVTAYLPGRRVHLKFVQPEAIDGFHVFEVVDGNEQMTVLRHTLVARVAGPTRVMFAVLIERLHDQTIEDAFDRADAQLRGEAWSPRPLPPGVRIRRAALRLMETATSLGS
jgi:hypothetical protein